MSENFTYLVIGLLVLFIGLIAIGFGYNQYKLSQERITKSEPIEGEVINNNIKKDLDSNDESNLYQYHFTIKYKYTVGGTEYTNNYVLPTSTKKTFESKSSAENYKSNHSVGSPITIYHMPDNPETSFIIKSSSSTIIIIIVGVMFVFAGAIVAIGRDKISNINHSI